MNRTRSGLTPEDRDVLRGLFEVSRADLADRLAAGDPEPEEIRDEIATLDGLLAAVDDDRLEPTDEATDLVGRLEAIDEVRRLVGELGGSVDGLLARLEGRRSAAVSGRAA